MSYRFCYGATGSGKSSYLQSMILEKAEKSLSSYVRGEEKTLRHYLYIVPEQYSLETEKNLVLRSGSAHGILNVDFLSFGRLSYRVFQESGMPERKALNDVGKALIVRRVSSLCEKDLTALSGKMSRPGYVTKVKDLISEFMKYDLAPDDVRDLADYAGERGQSALSARLTDVATIFDGFLSFEKDKFLTGEERLDLLAEKIPDSALIKGSDIVIDGFLGFTPRQYKVITALMKAADDVIIALPFGEDGGVPFSSLVPGQKLDPQDLFYLSRKTACDLMRCGKAAGAERGEDIDQDLAQKIPPRFSDNPGLAILSKALFRYPAPSYGGKNEAPSCVRLMCCSGPREEVRSMCIAISRMVREEGYAYRDFGVVTGNIETYGDFIDEEAAFYHIPVYVDRTRKVVENPLLESIRGLLSVFLEDFSYESVFHYLRAGLSGLSFARIDALENYCLANGIHSRRAFEKSFLPEKDVLSALPESTVRELSFVEESRKQFLQEIAPAHLSGRHTAAERTAALYAYLEAVHAQDKLERLSDDFEAKGDYVRSSEYAQIYAALIDLFDEIYDLLGDEKISAGDYLELLEAGFSSLVIGTIPQKVDRIFVGDIERSRMNSVKVLFLLGANDGNIPRSTSKGGLLSDLDREFLENAGHELAPTPREEMYIQRLHLYMNLLVCTERLIVSYTRTDAARASLRPSYLVSLFRQLFPGLCEEYPEQAPVEERLTGEEDALRYLSRGIRSFADGALDGNARERESFLTLYGYLALQQDTREELKDLTKTAFLRYDPKPLPEAAARDLYGDTIEGSVTRLESAAGCYLQHFLRYGLHLKERDEHRIDARDAGTLIHEGIQRFSEELVKENLSFRSLTPEDARRLTATAISQTQDARFLESARNRYSLSRMEKLLYRTATTLAFQVQKGDFDPAAFEADFGEDGSYTFPLSDGRKLILHGRIDRIDLCVLEDGTVLVKIVDYKSGDRKLEEDKMRAGLQLQLVLYMEAVLRGKVTGIPQSDRMEPAALLYYHFADPVLSGKDAVFSGTGEDPADVQKKVKEKILLSLRPKGFVVEGAVPHLDTAFTGDSDVIRVKKKKDGTLGVSKDVRTLDGLRHLGADMERVCCHIAEEILSGNVTADPKILGDRSTCTFCPFADACGFDRRLPGYSYHAIIPYYSSGEVTKDE